MPQPPRNGRPPFQPRSIDAMKESDGPPLSLLELATLADFSKDKVDADRRLKYLHAEWVRCGTRGQWMVSFIEARRYLVSIGRLRIKTATPSA